MIARTGAIALLTFALASPIGAGCKGDAEEPEPGESVGDEVEEGARDATEDLGEGVEETGEDVQDAAE